MARTPEEEVEYQSLLAELGPEALVEPTAVAEPIPDAGNSYMSSATRFITKAAPTLPLNAIPYVGPTIAGAINGVIDPYIDYGFDALEETLGQHPAGTTDARFAAATDYGPGSRAAIGGAIGGAVGLAAKGVSAAFPKVVNWASEGLTGSKLIADAPIKPPKVNIQLLASDEAQIANQIAAPSTRGAEQATEFTQKKLVDRAGRVYSKQDVFGGGPLMDKAYQGIDTTLANELQLPKFIDNLDNAIGRAKPDLNTNTMLPPDPDSLLGHRATLIDAADQAAGQVKAVFVGRGIARDPNFIGASIPKVYLPEDAGFPGLTKLGQEITDGRSALRFISAADDEIQALKGYINVPNPSQAQQAQMGAWQQQVDALRAVRREASYQLNEYVNRNVPGADDALKGINENISAAIGARDMAKLKAQSLLPMTNELNVTKSALSSPTKDEAPLTDISNRIKENLLGKTDIKKAQANRETLLRSTNSSLGTMKQMLDLKYGRPVKIPRDWSQIMSNQVAFEGLAVLAAQYGLMPSPQVFVNAPEPVQKSIAKQLSTIAGDYFEKAQAGYSSLFNGKFNNPAEERVQAAEVAASAKDPNDRYTLMAPLYDNGTFVPTPQQSQMPQQEEPLYTPPPFDMQQLDTILGDFGTNEPESDPAYLGTNDLMLNILRQSQDSVEPEEHGF